MWQTISVRETCERLKTNSVNGLTKDEAEERIKKYGENKLTEKKKESILVKFLKQFNDFMIIILIIAAAISAVMSYVEGSNDYLDSVTSSVSSYDTMWTVSVSTGYLALRNAPEYDASNEIGELYSGDTVWVSDSSNSQYWYVYSPKYDTNGFVNKDYLVGGNAYATLYVKVPTGYLALRSAMGYDAANEIGELNTGDTVVVIDSSSDKYWYVYSPRLMKYGYADCNYIFCN